MHYISGLHFIQYFQATEWTKTTTEPAGRSITYFMDVAPLQTGARMVLIRGTMVALLIAAVVVVRTAGALKTQNAIALTAADRLDGLERYI